MRGAKKAAAVTAAFVFVFLLVSPVVFSVCRGAHDCCGPDCRVCERFAVALGRFGGACPAAASAVCALGFAVREAVVSSPASRRGGSSPVKLKVKLTD